MLFTPTGVSNNPNPTTTDSSTYSAARGAREVNGNWRDGRNFKLPFPASRTRLQVLEFAPETDESMRLSLSTLFSHWSCNLLSSLHFQRSLLAALLLNFLSSAFPAYSSASTL